MARGRINDVHIEELVCETERTPMEERIKEESLAEVETTVPETAYGMVANTIHVKARRTPDPDGEVVEILRGGDKVTIHRFIRGFYEVSTSVNKHVFISAGYIRKDS